MTCFLLAMQRGYAPLRHPTTPPMLTRSAGYGFRKEIPAVNLLQVRCTASYKTHEGRVYFMAAADRAAVTAESRPARRGGSPPRRPPGGHRPGCTAGRGIRRGRRRGRNDVG